MTVHTRVDAKGKIFTNLIEKGPLRVLVQTPCQTLIGNMYLASGKRLLDELNDARVDFLALTDVQVYDKGAETVLYTTAFLALNKAYITAIAPLEDLVLDGGRGIWLHSLRAVWCESGAPEEG